MSSILSSQGVVLATAMAAAFSGTVILLALRHQKPLSSQFQVNPIRHLRPCLSSGERKGEKKKKRVRFAKDVVDPTGDNEEFRRQQIRGKIHGSSRNRESQNRGMPENRAVLYNGMIRDRVVHRLAYSY